MAQYRMSKKALMTAGLKASGFYVDRNGYWTGPDGTIHHSISSAHARMRKIYGET